MCILISFAISSSYTYTFEGTPLSDSDIKRLVTLDTSSFDSIATRKNLTRHHYFTSIHTKIDTLDHDQFMITILCDTNSTMTVSTIGGALKGKVHNKEIKFPKILLNSEIRFNNFMNSLSTLSIGAQGLHDKKLYFKWHSPIKPTYYLFFSSEIGTLTSETDPWDLKFYNKNQVSIEKYFDNSKFTVSLLPHFYNYHLIHDDVEDKFTELESEVSILFDHRDDDKNPRSGLYFVSSLNTNSLYPYNELDKKFRNLKGTYRFSYYLPLFSRKQTLLFTLSQESTLLGTRVPYKRLYLGGTKNVRGFSTGEFGHEFNYENRILSSLAYRFNLFKIPSIKLPFLKWYHKNFKDFPVDVDGGLFLDAGYLWPELKDIFALTNSYSALSFGAGLRISLPTVHIVGAIDVAIPIYATIKQEKTPHLHIYVELPF